MCIRDRYGLKARARQAAGFQAPEYGTFVHYVLEHVLQDETCRGTADKKACLLYTSRCV